MLKPVNQPARCEKLGITLYVDRDDRKEPLRRTSPVRLRLLQLNPPRERTFRLFPFGSRLRGLDQRRDRYPRRMEVVDRSRVNAVRAVVSGEKGERKGRKRTNCQAIASSCESNDLGWLAISVAMFGSASMAVPAGGR